MKGPVGRDAPTVLVDPSATAGGLAVLDPVGAPVVVFGCSSGYKDGTDWSAPRVSGTVEAVAGTVANEYGLDLSPRRP